MAARSAAKQTSTKQRETRNPKTRAQFGDQHGRPPGYSIAMHRRAFLQSAVAAGGATALGSAAGCAEHEAPSGRLLVPFWFMYGGRNRATLETLVARFNR